MPRVGLKRKKTRTHQAETIGESEKKIPRSFIVRRGPVSHSVKELVKDLRDVMAPNSAKALKETKSTKVKDYLAVAGNFGVSHLAMLSNNETATYLRIARLPQGPTITFKVNKFTLSRDIQATQKRPQKTREDFNHAPLLLMNNFKGDEDGTKLVSEVIRNMYQPIDVKTFSTNHCRRTCLYHREKNGSIQFRHFAITKKMHGVSRSIQKLVNGKARLGQGQDVADYILGGGYASDSEIEDDAAAVTKPNKKKVNETVGLNLVELGPRMELIPVKAEDGVMDGSVLFHRYVKKTAAEKEIADKKIKIRTAQREKQEKLTAKRMQEKSALRKKREEKLKKKREKQAENISGDENDNKHNALKSTYKQDDGEEVRPAKKEKYNPLYKKKKKTKDDSGAHHKFKKSGAGKSKGGNTDYKKKTVKKGGKKKK